MRKDYYKSWTHDMYVKVFISVKNIWKKGDIKEYDCTVVHTFSSRILEVGEGRTVGIVGQPDLHNKDN